MKTINYKTGNLFLKEKLQLSSSADEGLEYSMQLYRTFKNVRRTFQAVFLVMVCSMFSAKAQLTGTLNVPGSYPDLAAAIADLNLQGVGAGGVTINLVTGNPQTAPAGGYIIGGAGSAILTGPTATSVLNPVILEGNSNVITAFGGQTAGALNDGIFKIIGGDFITIQHFTMQENAGNSTITAGTNNMTEWGVALLYVSTTDGSQNNTIQNNNISLNRLYPNSFGVYSNVRHDPALVGTVADIVNNTTAPNNSNKVYANNVNNVNTGICFVGSGTAANMDTGNDIGGSSPANGNNLTNWGGSGLSSAFANVSTTGSMGMYMNSQVNLNVSNNILISASGINPAAIRGILTDFVVAPTGTFTNTISNNSLTISSGAASGTFEAIRSFNSPGGTVAGATLNITGNTILNCAITGSSSALTFVGISNTFIVGTLNMNTNIIRSNSSTATTGGFTGITNSAAVVNTVNLNNNQVGNNTGGAITLNNITSGIVNCIVNSGTSATCALSINNNNFQGVTYVTSATGAFQCIVSSGAVLSETINGNNFNNLTVNTASSTIGFLIAATKYPSGEPRLVI